AIIAIRESAMTATMNISLPEPLKKFVDGQVRQGGYSGASDYVRDLIRDHQKQVAAQQLRTLIAEGLNSGSGVVADKRYWTAKRKKLGA
ncbi:MAG TPA: type II toxin-antitoxin system ParD family antitoxin, partial [Stenotrophobium sp.]|nr:type II toxin-antitoxin system ParD family antitoxin [Stenotrophobium sp.]